VLKYQGRILDDNEDTLEDILINVNSDDEDEDKEKESDDESDIGEEDEDTIKVLYAKFGIEFCEKINKMSTRQIMEAYCINMEGDFDVLKLMGRKRKRTLHHNRIYQE